METHKKFEVGQFWKDNKGRKHQIMEIEPKDLNIHIITYCYGKRLYQNRESFIFQADGRSVYFKDISLTEPWQEPRSGEVWVNIYSDVMFNYTAKKEADARASSNRLARIKMPWKEGQFDE